MWTRLPDAPLLLLVLLALLAARAQAQASRPPRTPCCAVLELRQYTLHPGKRDVLIELFEREFVEGQEAQGMRILGQFRDAADPDRFVWLRGFADMRAREQALRAFYGGPVWKAHRDSANATMVDSSNVLLLRPLSAASGFTLDPARRPAVGAPGHPASRVVATLLFLRAPAEAALLRLFEREVRPALAAAGAPPVAAFQTEYAENTFPALPVRTGEHVLVWFSVFASDTAHSAHLAQLPRSRAWTERVLPGLQPYLVSPPQRLVLQPTPRSLLR